MFQTEKTNFGQRNLKTERGRERSPRMTTIFTSPYAWRSSDGSDSGGKPMHPQLPMPWSEEGSVGRNLAPLLVDYNFLLFQSQ